MSEEGPDYEAMAEQIRRRMPERPRLDCYILLNKETGEVRPTDMLGLSFWRAAREEFGEDPTRIAWDDVPLADGKVGSVSTVFLGFDCHTREPDELPALYETMVWGESVYLNRKSMARTVQEARENHARWMRVLQAEALGQNSEEAVADPDLNDLLGMLGFLLQSGRDRAGNLRIGPPAE